MKKIHTLIFFIFMTGKKKKKTHTYYYNREWSRANPENAVYYREISDTRNFRGYAYTDFFMNGRPKSSGYMKKFNNKNTINGPVIIYDFDGKTAEKSSYLSGKKHGKEIKYYRNGAIRSITGYKNGMKHGKEIKYFENETISYEANYKNDLLHGTETFYKFNGDIITKIEYKYNKYDGKYIVYN